MPVREGGAAVSGTELWELMQGKRLTSMAGYSGRERSSIVAQVGSEHSRESGSGMAADRGKADRAWVGLGEVTFSTMPSAQAASRRPRQRGSCSADVTGCELPPRRMVNAPLSSAKPTPRSTPAFVCPSILLFFCGVH